MSEQEIKTIQYDAFISYRHSELDKMVAEQLHKMLETFKVPKSIAKNIGKKKITRVFRDHDELPSSSNLADNITKALQNSEFLIVICSPRTPESQWVSKEIEAFSQMHGHHKILALLIEGEPDDSFPPALRFDKKQLTTESGEVLEELVAIEPLAADIRANSKKEMMKLLKKEILRLLATLLHCKYDDLKQRHRERMIRQIMTFSSFLTLFFALFGSFSLYQGIQIKAQMQKVMLTQSRYLSDVSARLLKEGDRRSAILVALEALPKDLNSPDRPYVEEAAFALSNALYTYKFDTRFVSDFALEHPNTVNFLKLNPDGTLAVTSCQDGYLYLWDTQLGTRLGKLRTSSPYLSEDKIHFLNNTDFIYLDATSLSRIDASSALVKWSLDSIYASMLTLSEDKNLIATITINGLLIIDNTGDTLLSIPLDVDFDTYICDLKFNTSGKILLVAQAGGTVSLVDLRSGSIMDTFKTTYNTLLNAHFIGDNQIAVISNLINPDRVMEKSLGILELFDFKTLKVIHTLDFSDGIIHDLTYLPQSDELLLIEGAKVNVISAKSCEKLASFIHGDVVSKYHLMNDIVITGSQDGTIRFWFLNLKKEYEPLRMSHLDSISSLQVNKGILTATYHNSSKAYIFRILEGSNLTRLEGHSSGVKYGEFSSDGKKALSAAFNAGELIVWDAENKKLLNQLNLDADISETHFIGATDLISILTLEGNLLTLDMLDTKPLKEMKLDGIMASYYSNDASLVGITLVDRIKIIDTQTHKTLLEIPSDYLFGTLSFSQDHTKLLISAAGSAQVYNLLDGKLLYSSEASTLQAAYLGNTGETIALVHNDFSIELIQIASKKQTALIKDIALSISKIVFSPDDNLLFVGLDNADIKIYETSQGRLIKTLDDLAHSLNSCSFSKDGKYLITMSDYNHALIWDAKSYKKLAQIDYLLDINASFTTLLSSNSHDTIVMPYYTLDKLLEEAKSQLGDLDLSLVAKEKLFITE